MTFSFPCAKMKKTKCFNTKRGIIYRLRHMEDKEREFKEKVTKISEETMRTVFGREGVDICVLTNTHEQARGVAWQPRVSSLSATKQPKGM